MYDPTSPIERRPQYAQSEQKPYRLKNARQAVQSGYHLSTLLAIQMFPIYITLYTDWEAGRMRVYLNCSLDRKILMLTIILTVLSFFHPYPYDNVVTRWALSRQLIDSGTLHIDPFQNLTNDKAFHEGHFFCDKAVLTSFAAAVPYAMARAGSDILNIHIPASAYRYIAERFTAGLSFVLLLLFIKRYLQTKSKSTMIPLLALGAGSILLPYSTLLYGHVPAAFLLFMSYYFQNRKRYLQADIFGALAAAVEFPVLLPFAILVIYRGRAYWKPARIIQLAGFLLIAFSPQLLHNYLAFGNPFTMGYSLEAAEAFQGMGTGFFGYTFPSLRALYLLLLSPERGLFFYMPWTFLGILGFFRGRNFIRVLKRDPLPIMTAAYVLLFSAYYMPSGGWAFGPRHLIPVIPFFCIGLSRFAGSNRRNRFIALLLILPSILITLVGVFGEIHQPVHPFEQPVPIPQVNIGITMLLDGQHSMWLLGTAGPVIVGIMLITLWFRCIRKSRFTLAGPGILLLWASLMINSIYSNWGGKVDYYRGVLAQHRQNWQLAAEYYEKAAEDPNAPETILERAEYCRRMNIDSMSEVTGSE